MSLTFLVGMVILGMGNPFLVGGLASSSLLMIKAAITFWRSTELPISVFRSDNLLKAPLDALTHAGVYVDDHLIVDLRIFWADGKGGRIKVKVEEIE